MVDIGTITRDKKIDIGSQVVSPLVSEINNIVTSDKYISNDPLSRMEMIGNYEDKLVNWADNNYEGGWEKYEKDNPLSTEYLVDRKRDAGRDVLNAIENNKRSFWENVTWGGERSIGFGWLLHSRHGARYVAADILYGLGKEKKAKKLEDLTDFNRENYKREWNAYARKIAEIDSKPLNYVFAFLKGIYPFIKPEDKTTLKYIAMEKGNIDENGRIKDKKFYEPEYLAEIMGQFSRQMVIFHMFPGSFNAIPYSLRYAFSRNIDMALFEPPKEQTFKRHFISFAATAGALQAGQMLTRLATKSPMVKKALAYLPGAVERFVEGRIADVGESLANSVHLAIRTADPWTTLKAFPAAILANFAEEIAIDLLPFSKGAGAGRFATQRLWQARQGVQAIDEKIEQVKNSTMSRDKKNKEIKNLKSKRKILKDTTDKRTKDYISALEKDDDFRKEFMQKAIPGTNIQARDMYKAFYEDHKNLGMTDIEAKEASIAQTQMYAMDMQGILEDHPDAKEPVEMMNMAINGLKKAGNVIRNITGAKQVPLAEGRLLQPGKYDTWADFAHVRNVKLTPEQVNIPRDMYNELGTKEGNVRYRNNLFRSNEKDADSWDEVIEKIRSEDIEGVEEMSDTEIQDAVANSVKKEVRFMTRDKPGQAIEETGVLGSEYSTYADLFEKNDRTLWWGVLEAGSESDRKELFKKHGAYYRKFIRANKNDADITKTDQLGMFISDIGLADRVPATYSNGVKAYPGEVIKEQINNEIGDVVAGIDPSQRDVTDRAFAERREELVGDELKRLEEELRTGKITSEEYYAWMDVIEMENKLEELYDTSDQRGLSGEAVKALQRWIKTLPASMQAKIIITPRQTIAVNMKRFKEIMGTDFKGQDVTGKTYKANGEVFVELAFDAPVTTAHQEAFRIAQFLALSKSDMDFLYDQIGTLEAQARAYAKYVALRQPQTSIGRVFSKIKEMLTSLRNYFTGQGFRSVESIFRQVHEGKLSLLGRGTNSLQQYFDNYNHRGFLTKDGFRSTISHSQEYGDLAKENNWVRKSTDGKALTYSVGELNKSAENLIKEDINRYVGDKSMVVLRTPERTYVFSKEKFKDDLNSAIEEGYTIEREMDAEELYDSEREDPAEQASRDARELVYSGKTKQLLAKVPLMKHVLTPITKEAEDMTAIEALLELPSFAKDKYPEVKQMIDRESARQREKFDIIDSFEQTLIPYWELPDAERASLNKLLLDLDADEREYDSEEEIMKSEGVSQNIAMGYRAVREALDSVQEQKMQEIDKEIEYQQKRMTNEDTDAALAAEIIESLKEEKQTIKDQLGKGYFPHAWEGKNVISFTLYKDDLTQNRKEKLSLLRKIGEITGHGERIVKQARRNISQDGSARIRIQENSVNNHKVFEVIENMGVTINKNDLRMYPHEDNINMFDFATQRSGVERVIDNVIDRMGIEDTERVGREFWSTYRQIEKAQGHRRHELERKGVLGYESRNTEKVLQGYLSGFAGSISKRHAAEHFNDIVHSVSTDKTPKRRKYIEGFRNQLMHNQDKVDKIQNKITAFIFAKYLGFNPAFHIRNEAQNYYMGVPVLTLHGIKHRDAWKSVAKYHLKVNQHFIPFLSTNFYGKTHRTDAEDIADSISGLNSEEHSMLVDAIGKQGLLGETMEAEFFKESFNDETGNKIWDWIKKGANKYIEHAGYSVNMSDARNRVHMVLASYDLLKSDNIGDKGYDESALEEAIEITRKTNVQYKRWNIPPVLWTDSPGRYLKPLFQFQRFGWHITRLQWQMITEGHRGALGSMWAITALLGGAGTLPFWERLMKLLGLEVPASKVREKVVKSLGGEGAILDMWDHGLAGMAGISMKYQLQIRPFALADPLFGQNAPLSMLRDFKKTAGDISRGRLWKALETMPFTPGFAGDISRAIRQKHQGVTTFRGDIVLDLNGEPLELSYKDAMKSAFGFLPTKIANHYRSTGFARGLMKHFSNKKSGIGTRYKLAFRKKDKSELNNLKRAIKQFNKRLKNNEVNGSTPVPKITNATLKAWRKGSGTKRMRDIAKYYYPL